METMNHFYYKILANSPEEQVSHLAALVTQAYSASQVKLLSGPRLGLVMLRMQETVANSQFNAGEVLVTEVSLELEGQFGFGMVMGNAPRRAMAVALLDAAIRKGGPLSEQLLSEIAELARQLQFGRQQVQQMIAASKVEFETMG